MSDHGRFATWASEWIETLRIAPPFSKRRRDIILAIRDAEDPNAWVRATRPHLPGCANTMGYNGCTCSAYFPDWWTSESTEETGKP